MYNLSVEKAKEIVRKNLDEIGLNESIMASLNDSDSENLDAIITRTVAEAINTVHRNADVSLLDGVLLEGTEINEVSINDAVLSFSTKKEILRLVAFKASDSEYVISGLVSESSAVGRMQHNPYTRGTYDNPRLVMLQGRKDGKQTFNYYSLRLNYKDPKEAIERFEYIPIYRSNETSYYVATNFVEQVGDCLTGMVLAIYGQSEKASYFMSKAGLANTTGA